MITSLNNIGRIIKKAPANSNPKKFFHHFFISKPKFSTSLINPETVQTVVMAPLAEMLMFNMIESAVSVFAP